MSNPADCTIGASVQVKNIQHGSSLSVYQIKKNPYPSWLNMNHSKKQIWLCTSKNIQSLSVYQIKNVKSC